MAEASRRAARPARKGGLPNAAFALATAESPPPELCGAASLVTVRFPWGSLLRGLVGLDVTVAAGIAGLVAPDGTLELLLAPAERDGLDGVPTWTDAVVEGAAQAFGSHGFVVAEARTPTAAEILATGSTWARRLGAARSNGARPERAATLIRLVRR
jgi:16S rRNA (adenine(1408)-N(1))-methyltransferase